MNDIVTAISAVAQVDATKQANKQALLMWRLDRLTPALCTLTKLPQLDKPSPELLSGSLRSCIDTYLDASIILLGAAAFAQDGLVYSGGCDHTLCTCINIVSSSFEEINSYFFRWQEAQKKCNGLFWAKQYNDVCAEWGHKLYQAYTGAYHKYVQLLGFLRSEITKQRNDIRMELRR